MYTIDQQLKNLRDEKDHMAAESEDRIKLSLKKAELENLEKNYKKMLGTFHFHNVVVVVIMSFTIFIEFIVVIILFSSKDDTFFPMKLTE